MQEKARKSDTIHHAKHYYHHKRKSSRNYSRKRILKKRAQEAASTQRPKKPRINNNNTNAESDDVTGCKLDKAILQLKQHQWVHGTGPMDCSNHTMKENVLESQIIEETSKISKKMFWNTKLLRKHRNYRGHRRKHLEKPNY